MKVRYLLIVLGLLLLLLSIFVVIPTAKGNSENCTLQLEATVINNREYTSSDSDDLTRTYYDQEIVYMVNEKEYEKTIYSRESDPVEIGSKIIIWVDPNDPDIMTVNKDWKLISGAAIGVSCVFLIIGITLCFIPKRMNLITNK